jgi:3'-phosphoadenosine 5'-phosphosulfate (PAPS) 3'-phosphatase
VADFAARTSDHRFIIAVLSHASPDNPIIGEEDDSDLHSSSSYLSTTTTTKKESSDALRARIVELAD